MISYHGLVRFSLTTEQDANTYNNNKIKLFFVSQTDRGDCYFQPEKPGSIRLRSKTQNQQLMPNFLSLSFLQRIIEHHY